MRIAISAPFATDVIPAVVPRALSSWARPSY